MAIKKPASEVKKAPSAVASLNPDNMISGGLKDDFDGRIVKARFVPWDYDGNLDHDILAVAVTIAVDGEEEFVQHYSAGELEQFAPSMDGEEPVDLEGDDKDAMEGIYALRVGKKEGLNNNTNWAHFLGALIDAGFPKASIGASVDFIEGLYGHWNRVPQKKRSGIITQANAEAGKKRNSDILVITELKEAETAPKATKSAAKTPAPAAKATAPKAAAGGGMDDQLREIVKKALADAGDDGLPKSKLAPLALKAFSGPDKAKAVKRIGEAAFLEEGEDWVYDADSGIIMAIG